VPFLSPNQQSQSTEGFIKIQNGLPLWCWLTQVVLEKGSLNGCSTHFGNNGDNSDRDDDVLHELWALSFFLPTFVEVMYDG